MTGKRTQVLVRLAPELLERIDAARPGTRNDWLLEAIEAHLPGDTAPRPAKGERLRVALEVKSSAEAKVGVTPRSWR